MFGCHTYFLCLLLSFDRYFVFYDRHRDISAHGCTAEDPKETAKSESSQKNATARQLLAKHFPQAGLNKSTSVVTAASGSGSNVRTAPTNPKKAAQLRQVQAMKLRHKAQPGDPRDKGKVVGLSEKLHLLVHLEGGNAEPKVFWFRKVYIRSCSLNAGGVS